MPSGPATYSVMAASARVRSSARPPLKKVAGSSRPETRAASVIVAAPVVIAYVALQRKFIAGMLAGAIRE